MIFIGICGASGSGKSTLAESLKAKLGDYCYVLPQDCYYKDNSHLPFEERTQVNYDAPDSFDQEALLDAIDMGYISAAGLDVNEREPLKDLSDRTFQYDTVILTPHSATESVEYFANLQEKVARTAIIALQGKLPPNIINREVLEKLQMSENT